MSTHSDSTDEQSSEEEPTDPRLAEVEGDSGMPGELLGGEHNLPGSQKPPPGARQSSSAISDAKGTTDPDH